MNFIKIPGLVRCRARRYHVPMRKLLDRNDPFFRHAWVRWLTVILPIGWGGVEFWHSQPFWGVLFLAAGLYAAWELLLRAAD